MGSTSAPPGPPGPSTSDPTIPAGSFTVLKVDGTATKRIRWDGSKITILSAPPLVRGTYRREVASSVDALRRIIEQLPTSEVLTWGVPAHVEGVFVTNSDLAGPNGGAPASIMARTRDAFSFAPPTELRVALEIAYPEWFGPTVVRTTAADRTTKVINDCVSNCWAVVKGSLYTVGSKVPPPIPPADLSEVM